MSFYSYFHYYRPGIPPSVTGNDLRTFVANIYKSGLVSDRGYRRLKVKFGQGIDQDDKPSYWFEVPKGGIFEELMEIDWDIDFHPPYPKDGKNWNSELIDHLVDERRNVYRASVWFGTLLDEVWHQIARRNSPENDRDFIPYNLSLKIDQVEIGGIPDEKVVVGSIALTFSGDGYLYPWTLRDLVKRADDSLEIATLTKLCRDTWPVPPKAPSPELVAEREKIKKWLPFDDLNAPPNWFWGVNETG